MNDYFYISLALTIFSSVALLGSFFSSQTSRATLRRIQEVTEQGKRLRWSVPIARDAGRRFFATVHWVRGRLGLPEDAVLPDRLAQAGYKGILAADIFASARVLCPVLGLVAGALIPWSRSFWIISLPAIGYLVPDMTLNRLIRRRRERIRMSIPDTIDLLVICVDAGLGIDQALLRVSDELGVSHPDITQELLQINREQRAGRARLQAWQDLAARCELPEIDALANMLLQTERFGTPIARALSAFAEHIRLKRRQLAEEMAAKTTVKIIFPLVLFIFPSLFIVLLGPAALTILRGMSAMAH